MTCFRQLAYSPGLQLPETRPEKDPVVFMRICQCLYVLSQTFCNVIPRTSLLSYVVIWKHTMIEDSPDPYICRTLCPIHDS